MKTFEVALLCSLTLLANPVKDVIVGLLTSTKYVPAFEGDGILIADTGYNPAIWPNTFATRWSLQQRPVFGDAHHTISFYMAPKRIAHHFLHRFDSDFTSEYFFVDGERQDILDGHQRLAIRQNVYFLPEEYTPGKKAEAKFLFKVKKSQDLERNQTLGYSVCQFENIINYGDFIDMEPSYNENGFPCQCNYEDTLPCNDPDECHNRDVLASTYCSSNDVSLPYFTATTSSYNYFSAVVPTKSYVKYTANMTMYFYKEKKLINHAKYLCTIRNEDTCSFITPQSLYWNNDPQLIIAYIHPKIGPYALTTTIAVETDVVLLQNLALSLLYLLIPGTLIRICYVYY